MLSADLRLWGQDWTGPSWIAKAPVERAHPGAHLAPADEGIR